MADTTLSITMDENLKKQFDLLCSRSGMNISAAFCSLARKAVREDSIPSEASAEKISLEEGRKAFYELRRQAHEKFPNGMTMEEIDEEIRKTRYVEGE